MNENQNSVEDKSNMYSYQGGEDPKSKENRMSAIGRSAPGNDFKVPMDDDIQPKNNNFDPDTITIHIDQSPPPYWMFFIVFAIIQIIILLLIGFYYNWDDGYTNPRSIYNNTNNTFNESIDDTHINGSNVYLAIEYKYKHFQEVNIMILLGFGFLNSFLKHYSWTGLALTIIACVLSTEFGLFMLICWRAIFTVEWNFGRFNFQHLLDANLCAGSVIISLGAVLGKISMAQYLILILTETIGVTFNYTLLRQVIKLLI
jgi:hypothetical protein